MLLCDEYLTPKSLDDAFDLIEANRGRYRLVAGATDLLPWAREGRAGDVHIPVLIDVSRIAELRCKKSVRNMYSTCADTFKAFLLLLPVAFPC